MKQDLITHLNKFPIALNEALDCLAAGCWDANVENSSGITPLKAIVMNATEAEAKEIIDALVSNGATVDIKLIDFAKLRYPSKTWIFPILNAAMTAQQISNAIGNFIGNGRPETLDGNVRYGTLDIL
jgi:hypothetical protein